MGEGFWPLPHTAAMAVLTLQVQALIALAHPPLEETHPGVPNPTAVFPVAYSVGTHHLNADFPPQSRKIIVLTIFLKSLALRTKMNISKSRQIWPFLK